MNPRSLCRFSQVSLAVAGAFGLAYPASGANTDIANEPLSQAAAGVRPNVMFILDDSGSMDWDFSPDYVDDVQPSGATPSTTAACFDAGDTGSTGTTFSQDFDDAAGSISGRPDHCIPGDPPYMSPDFNKQYYNPAIYYRPGVNSDGSDKTKMNAASTSNWTAVPTDPYGQQQDDQRTIGKTNENLVANYPDRAWCRNTGDNVNSTTDCRVNAAYTYPNHEFNKGLSTTASDYGNNFGNVKFRYGAPYYYRMQTAQWCSDTALTNCVSGNAVNPTVHTFIAAEFCTDSELVNCAAGAAVTAAHTFSGPRWCSDQTTLQTCQRKKVGNFRWPKHLGVTKDVTVNIAAPLPANGTLTVTQATNGLQVTSITVDGISLIAGPVTSTSNSTNTLATQIRTAINAHTSTPNYSASGTGNSIVITTSVAGAQENGKPISVIAQQSGTTRATATITVNNGGGGNTYVDAVDVGHPSAGILNLFSNATLPANNSNCTGSYGNSVTTETGGSFGRRIRASSGTNSSNERTSMADAIENCIDQMTGTSGFSANQSGDTVTILAPTSLGAQMNGRTVTVVLGGSNGSFSTTTFSGGVSSGIVVGTSGSLGSGADAVTGTIAMRAGVGQFSRTNIVSSNNSYPRASGRIDCAGTNCTFAEEMTNFANWYAYYRTRMQMMKSAAGRAFVPIDDTYRVGFITINPGSPVSSTRYLRVQNFESVHKGSWYTKFYAQGPSGGTPLREALSRVGRLFAGQTDGINNGIPAADDPMEVSCQPNFAILSTDGYWTNVGTSGNQVDNSSMTQQDNTNTAPYSLRSDGVYDGNPSSPTVGLADVALYYYKTDLRPTGSTNAASVDVSPDNVPTTQNDFAAHQHMTTFTLGLGLDGTLSYRSDYQTANTGDFFAIKQGTLNWPNPVADSPQSLDDLWHAAVNGRGVFFSASNPQELANSLTDTLDALKKRVGAGAAAATSNLQPVAGDNFAFTAQYQTQDWIGDLKARTIDLTTGAISAVELWSAQALLSGRPHTDRRLYTFDASDPYVSTSTGSVGNQMKHFCLSVLPIAPWCDDGSGLNATEQAYFNPNKLPQYVSYNLLQLLNVSNTNLVNFLRGHQQYEDTGAVAATDLFRQRNALLGDIINAQPSYVKSSPFNYSDAGYSAFKACTLGTSTVACPSAQFPDYATYPTRPRLATVYIAANDGMLHAIETDVNFSPYYQTGGIGTATTGDDTFSAGNNVGNGVERWSYIPGMVLPDLYKLASIPYTHRYFVDGSPTVADVCLSAPCAGLADWRTVLVGGLNSGGRGYYALDITNPKQPRALWEFTVRKPSLTACAATTAAAVGTTTDCDLGLSYGNPVITKLKSTGQWVVIVSSGLNNTGYEPGTSNRQGDGGGYLYILELASGRILHKIATGVGDPGTLAANYVDANPSGLAKMNNFVDSSLVNNTTLAVYAGDMMGNLWRFDLDNSSATYLTAVKVAELKDAFGTAQPVTTRPELGLINSRRVIFVGTGRFLGTSDKSNTAKQSIYAIADDLIGNVTVTDRSPLVQQTITTVSSTQRTVATVNVVDWTSAAVRGWFIDLPDKGERVSVDPQLQLGTLVVGSNVPSTDTCVAGGTAWINSFDFRSGGYVAGATANAVSQKVSGSVAVGINVIQLPGGKVVTVVTTADNQQLPVETPVAPPNFQGKRVGWRELNADQ
jgi:type IV pilus assembly protein PilY1